MNRKIKARLFIEPIRTLPYHVRTYTEKDINEFIEDDKKDLKKLKKKNLLSSRRRSGQ